MLTYVQNEQDVIRERGLSASTFVAQPFWQELRTYMHDIIGQKLADIEGSVCASDVVKARFVEQYIQVKELVARIERFPQAAIEAARESGE